MEKEELKALFAEELKAFKDTLPKYADKESVDTAFKNFNAEITAKFEGIVKQSDLDKLSDAVKAQGTLLAEMKQNQPSGAAKNDFREKLAEAVKNFNPGNPAEKQSFVTTRKAVYSTSFTSDTDSFQVSGVGEIKRGVPFIREAFQIVNLGSDSHDTVSWWEQASITNNAANAAEVRNASGMSESGITWVKKNLNSERIHDYIKVGVDRLKDVNFVQGEVMRLINRNMRLKENDQLINGTGTGNELAGILTYATAFDTTGIQIDKANLIDLLGKIKTQVDKDMLGAATPDKWFANRIDVDSVRYEKTTDGAYLFPQWALGMGDVNVAGMTGIENPLVTVNTLLAGDFSLATLYVWDDLMVEMYYEGTDRRDGLVTIGAYMRENLRVQDVDKKAFVKVADLAATIALIATPEA